MAWIKSDSAMNRHPKIIKLGTALRWDRNSTIGFLHRLWWTVLEYSPSGELSTLSAQTLAEMLVMKIEVLEQALSVMKSVGLIDELADGREVIHDWFDYAGEFLRKKFDAKTDKLDEIRGLYNLEPSQKNHGGATAELRRRDSAVTAPRLDKTRLDQTRSDLKEKNIKKEKSAKSIIGPTVFATQWNETEESKILWGKLCPSDWSEAKKAHYWETARDWSASKNGKMIDWVAAVRNWDRKSPWSERGNNAGDTRNPKKYHVDERAYRLAAIRKDWKLDREGNSDREVHRESLRALPDVNTAEQGRVCVNGPVVLSLFEGRTDTGNSASHKGSHDRS